MKTVISQQESCDYSHEDKLFFITFASKACLWILGTNDYYLSCCVKYIAFFHIYFSGKVFVFSFSKVLSQLFKITYQVVIPKIPQLIWLMYCSVLITFHFVLAFLNLLMAESLYKWWVHIPKFMNVCALYIQLI